MKVFLGGTCNNDPWREYVKPLLQVDYFDPVVSNWTPECKLIEDQEKASSDCELYVITSKMTGMYSIAEAVDSSNKKPTVLCILLEGFDVHQAKSLKAVAALVINNGADVVYSLDDAIYLLNNKQG